MTKALLCGLLLTLPATLALGQTQTQTKASNDTWQTIFFEQPETALPLLTAAALRQSGQLRAMEIDKSLGQQNIQVAKKAILNTVALQAGYFYGNQPFIGLNNPENPNQPATSNVGRYQVGAGVALPIGAIATRGNLVKREKLNYERSQALLEDQQNLIRQQLIPLYQNVRLARKVLTLQQEALVSARSNYQLAERQFRQGQLQLANLSEANGQLTSATIAQETARNQYDTAFMLLEQVVGARISTLMTAR